MIINLISNLYEGKEIEKVCYFNHVVAWSLREAFEKQGVEACLVPESLLEACNVPSADHSIVISAAAMKLMRATDHVKRHCRKHLRAVTMGKTALYLDSDFMGWGRLYDYVFTLARPTTTNVKYIYAGWGANPKFFYPEQGERAVYLDSLMYGKYDNKFNHIYDIYNKMMSETDLTVLFPLPEYNKPHARIPWLDIQKIIRKSHYYCCTQLGEGGLTRLEAATCGALLVVPKVFYRPKTMETLEHRIWETEDELIDILSTETDVEAIRKKALEHSWDKVADRMLNALEDKPS